MAVGAASSWPASAGPEMGASAASGAPPAALSAAAGSADGPVCPVYLQHVRIQSVLGGPPFYSTKERTYNDQFFSRRAPVD